MPRSFNRRGRRVNTPEATEQSWEDIFVLTSVRIVSAVSALKGFTCEPSYETPTVEDRFLLYRHLLEIENSVLVSYDDVEVAVFVYVLRLELNANAGIIVNKMTNPYRSLSSIL